jgi:NDP-sugar pyrophosphorylase family protein
LSRRRFFKRPTQAVILAGGRGTRLKPLIDARPKPMVEIQGKPFLEYQIEQLREQGFERVLLLLGYLPEVIRDYFGNGRQWGITIEYSVSAVEDETGRRLKFAEPFLDPCFLLVYCDHYWPMQIHKMWQHFNEAGAPAMLTVYTNKEGYTQNSVCVEANGLVSMYDKSGKHPALNGVEISYAILKREIIRALTEENLAFETTVYPALAQKRKLAAFVTDDPYFSIGALHRLAFAILDRDGAVEKEKFKDQCVACGRVFRADERFCGGCGLPYGKATAGVFRFYREEDFAEDDAEA